MRLSDDSCDSPDVPSRRVITGRLSWTAIFSVTEIWAVLVVITQIRVAGVDAAALALVISGMVLTMCQNGEKCVYSFAGPIDRMARHHVPVGNHRIPLVSGLSNSTGPGRPTVAGAVDASDVGCLPRGALDPGPDLVVVVPLVGALLGAGLLDGVVDMAGRSDS